MAEVTIYTLAEELNMTPSMVSRAFSPNGKINEEKRKRVLELAAKYNFSPNKFASRLSRKDIRIGILLRSRFTVNTEKMLQGINQGYEKVKDYKIEYDITVINPEEDSGYNYGEILDKYAGYDGIIISGFSSSRYTGIINECYRINPNIVQVQTKNTEANYLFASKHSEVTASRMAAEFLHNCLKRSVNKNVILFTGNKESSLHISAEEEFRSACCENGLNVLESFDMKDNDEYLKSILPDIFEQYGNNVEGIYITSGVSGALCEYIEKNGLDVTLVTFDIYPEIKKYMEKGIISATVEQDVSGQMQNAFVGLVRHLIDRRELPETIYTDVQLVFKSNMHQFGG